MRYANPVVENTWSRCEARATSSSCFGEEFESAARDTMGSSENEVDILILTDQQNDQ